MAGSADGLVDVEAAVDALTSPRRLAALKATGLMDSPPEPGFDRLTRLATRLLVAPVALVSLVDDERQFFKSAAGLDGHPAQRGTPLSHSFCRHVVALSAPLIVDEAPLHPLVCDNPAVTALGVMAYLGTPLVTEDGHVLGSFCVIDMKARRWSTEDLENLQLLAHSVASEMSLRRGNDILEQRVAEAVASREQAEDALRQSQKMEAIGQLTGGIAHDFNNMLTGITGSLEMLKRRVADGRIEEMPRFIETALGSATRAAGLTHRLLAFARRQSLDPKPVDVNALIVSMGDLFRQTLGEGVEMAVELDADIAHAFCDANQLESALLNLAINARDALGTAGRFTIETQCGDGLVAIKVADTGSGMAPEALARAFEPFFTTKPAGHGTGLGLSQVYGFVNQSGGQVTIDSAPGMGTVVTLHLPRAEAPAPVAKTPAPLRLVTPAPGIRKLLVVEDDPAVRQLVVEALEVMGHVVTSVADGTAAVPLLADTARTIDLLVSDVGLPGLNGRQVAEIARQHRPALPVLFITGYANQARNRGDFLAAGMEMVAKPFALDELMAKVTLMLARG